MKAATTCTTLTVSLLVEVPTAAFVMCVASRAMYLKILQFGDMIHLDSPNSNFFLRSGMLDKTHPLPQNDCEVLCNIWEVL